MTHTRKIHIAIFASGSGTNAENFIRFFQNHPGIEVSLIVSNKADAFVLNRARQHNVPAEVIPADQWKDASRTAKIFEKYGIDFIVLAGYLLLIPQWLIDKYPDKIINIHPALLPSYGGKGMYGDNVHRAVLEARDRKSGITIHYVNGRYDEGDIIFQTQCAVTPDDTPKSLAEKVHALEYEHYPKVAEEVILSKF